MLALKTPEILNKKKTYFTYGKTMAKFKWTQVIKLKA